MKKPLIVIFLIALLITTIFLSGCSTTRRESYASNGYYQIEGEDLMNPPIYPKIHLEITNRGEIKGEDVQQTLIFTMNGREVHEETVYWGDIPVGEMRSKDLVVELNISDDELSELNENHKLLDWDYGETLVDGKVVKNATHIDS